MKHLLRTSTSSAESWALNFATAVSAVLCIGVVVLWVRSYRVQDTLYWRRVGTITNVFAASSRGTVRVEALSHPDFPTPAGDPEFEYQVESASSLYKRTSWHGFESWSDSVEAIQVHNVVCPLWTVVLLLAAAPALWLACWPRPRTWTRTGLCLACGNDLTGNLSGTCPECGTAVARKGST